MKKNNSFYDYEARWKDLKKHLEKQMEVYENLTFNERKVVKPNYLIISHLYYRFFTRNHLEEL